MSILVSTILSEETFLKQVTMVLFVVISVNWATAISLDRKWALINWEELIDTICLNQKLGFTVQLENDDVFNSN